MPRIWLITGGSSGFGREIALAAAQNNDTVVVTSRDPTKLTSLAAQGIIPRHLDLSSSDSTIQQVISEVESSVGPIDILVNNAGYILEGAVEETSDDELTALFDTNVFAQMRILRAVLPSMRSRRTGVVANIGSIGGWYGAPAAGFYCASKAAVAMYTEALHHEVAHLGIKVTCIEPGYFRTDLLAGEHKVTVQGNIPDLDAATKEARGAMAAFNHRQPGDPVKGARVIVEALTGSGRCEGRGLPARLALGRDAMAAIGGSLAREREMLDGWEEIITSTDCDDVETV
ncbi:hypothetical protein BDV18DRAFT_161944 [Aspergillus unguis]